jgi:hypothetical protein
MRLAPSAALSCLIACVAAAADVTTAASTRQDTSRSAIIAALESLMVTGEPHHTDHDAGQWLQLAVDDAIARGDREIEKLAIRAAAPLVASVNRPVSSTLGVPFISFNSRNVLRLKNPVPYTAHVYASADNAGFVRVAVVESGRAAGGRVDVALSAAAGMPGFHVVQLKAVLTFGTTDRSGTAAAWTESRTLPAVFYGVYDPVAESSAAMRALMFGPAAVPVRELDPLLGDEPLAAWLSGLLSTRRSDKDSAPEWLSQYCDERTSEAGARPAAGAICAVVYFQSRGEIGQIWFRTAELVQTERGPEWSRLAPPRFEGMVMHGAAQESRQLSRLPSLLDTSALARPIGDVSISPADIEILAPAFQPGALIGVEITVRNAGDGDLHKALVNVTFGTDPAARGTSRQFVLDIPAHESTVLKLQAAFPSGYGFVLAHALQLTEHSPHDTWMPDPTPENACAFRVVNARLAPPKYLQTLMPEAGGGCSGK